MSAPRHLHWRRILACCAALTPCATHAAGPPASLILSRAQLVESRGQVDPGAMALLRDNFGRTQAVYVDTTALAPGARGAAGLKLARSTGWSWQTDELASIDAVGATPTGADLIAVRRAIDGSVQVLLLEPRGAGTADDRLRYLRRGGTVPALDEVIAEGPISQPRLAIDAQGDVYAAWLHAAGTDGNGMLRAARRIAETWSPIALGDPMASEPALAAYPNAAGVELGWLEPVAGGGNRVQLRTLPNSGPAGPATTVANATPLTLVIDFALAAGNSPQLEAILVRSLDGNGYGVEHRIRGNDGWLCFNQQPNCRITTFTAPHRIPAQGFVLAGNLRAVALQGPEESVLRLPAGAPVWAREWVAPQRIVALSQGAGTNDLPVALGPGVGDDPHRDLWLQEIGPQWRARRVPNDSNTLLHGALALAQDREGNPLVLGTFNAAGTDVRLLRWSAALDNFQAESIPGLGTISLASLADAGGDGRVHAAVRSDLGLLHAERDAAGGWSMQIVAAGNGQGGDPTMLLGPGGQQAIVYLDGARLPRVAVRSAAGAWQVQPMAETAVPAGTPLRAAIGRDGFLLHASFHDGQRLQHVVRSGDFTLGPSTLAQAPVPTGFTQTHVVGELHALTALGEGGFGIAYTARDTGTQAVRLGYIAFGSDGSVVGNDLGPLSPNGPISAMALTVGQGAGNTPRVLWVQGDSPASPAPRRLHYVQTRLDSAQHDNFGVLDVGPTAPPQLALQGEGRVTIGWVDGQNLWLARRRAPIQDSGAVLSEHTGASQTLPDFDVFPYCYCLLQQFLFGGPNVDACPPDLPGRAAPPRAGQGEAPLIARLRQRFATTPGGQYYLDLWTTHAREITTLTLGRPDLLGQRWRTWADLRPGLEALVDGHGNDFRFNADLVRATREVWQGWTGIDASPELRDAVLAELDRLDQFAGFEGMGFEQWFQQLTPAGPADRLFGDGFEP